MSNMLIGTDEIIRDRVGVSIRQLPINVIMDEIEAVLESNTKGLHVIQRD